MDRGLQAFTFHYVSINTRKTHTGRTRRTCFTFHYVSINTYNLPHLLIPHSSLHSTMFLLIPIRHSGINSLCSSLHSTMFLLIQKAYSVPAITLPYFTFHYVSINTWKAMSTNGSKRTLHSTMFLLILTWKTVRCWS